jgi:GNAT superfamily N-acetyltransferase
MQGRTESHQGVRRKPHADHPGRLHRPAGAAADPKPEGLQLPARDDAGRAVGFATLYWTWQTLVAARVGVMNDLFVAPEARGMRVADGLIVACLERCREHGATRLVWQTATDNRRAQGVYARVGATRDDRWLDYDLPVQPV